MEYSQNIFGESQDNTQNIEARQQLPRQNYTEEEGISSVLQQIFDEIKDVKERLLKVEENQNIIVSNQAVLRTDQSTLVGNQERLAEAIERTGTIPTAEFKALTNLVLESKVSIRKVEASMCRITGETTDRNLDEVATMMPLKTISEVLEAEEKLKSPEFDRAMKIYVVKCKGVSENVGSVIRHIFTDDLLDKYNWEGRFEKNCLRSLGICQTISRDVFSQQVAVEFEKNIRKAVEKGHHRVKQKAYAKKLKEN